MPKKRTIKAKTYAEFMAWLEGVESMQADDWVPNLDQWKLIRQMLDKIKVETKMITKEVPAAAPVAQFVPMPAAPMPAAPVNVAPPMGPPASTFEVVPTPRQLPSGLAEGGRNGVPTANSSKANEVLDTSNVDYTSEYL